MAVPALYCTRSDFVYLDVDMSIQIVLLHSERSINPLMDLVSERMLALAFVLFLFLSFFFFLSFDLVVTDNNSSQVQSLLIPRF